MAELPIGVVGGMGPWAGIELCRHITRHTRAVRDQDHLTIYLASEPAQVADRTDFLLGNSLENPADAVVAIIRRLAQTGARIIGIPCNTIHAPAYWRRICERVESEQLAVRLVSIVDAVADRLESEFGRGAGIGILGTAGTIATDIYGPALARRQLVARYLADAAQIADVHRAIYDPEFGLKARFDPATGTAEQLVTTSIEALATTGVAAIVLGCTELPFALKPGARFAVPIVDPSLALARALVDAAAPGRWCDDS